METIPVQITDEEEAATYFLTPTVIIGLGQVGSEAVNCLREQLYALNENLLHVIKGIAVSATLNTANNDNEQSDVFLDAVKQYNLWDASELSSPSSSGQACPSPNSVANELNRKACFTQFVQGADNFEELLGQTFRELREEREKAVDAGLRLNERYRVVLVGSLTDGVSSGLALEAPYFVQHIAPEIGLGELSSDDLLAIYTLDEFDIEEDIARSNAYAALKELNHSIDEQKYTRDESEVEDLPFKWCFLINSTTGGLGIENSTELADLLATMLSAILLSRFPEQIDQHQDDSLSLFGTMGVSFLSLPLRSIKEYAAKKQSTQLVDFLTSQGAASVPDKGEWNFNEAEQSEITDRVLDCLPKRDEMEKRLKTVTNKQGEEQILDFSLSWEAYDDAPPFSELISKINALKKDYQECQREEFLLKIEQNSIDTVESTLDKIAAQVDRYIQRQPTGIAKAFTFLKQLHEYAQRQKENVQTFLNPEVDIQSSRSFLEKSLSEYSTKFAVMAKMLLPAIFLTLLVYNCFAVYLSPFVWGAVFSGVFFLIIAVWGAQWAYGKLENSVELAKGEYISNLREISRTEINANVHSRINEAYEQIQASIGKVEEILNSGSKTDNTIAGRVFAFQEKLKQVYEQIDQITISHQPSETEICLIDPLSTEAVEQFIDQFGKQDDVSELLFSFLQSEKSPLENWQNWTEEDCKNLFESLWRFLKGHNAYLEEVSIEAFIAQNIFSTTKDFEPKVINMKDKSAPLITWTRELDFDEGHVELRSVISHSGDSNLPQKYDDILSGFDTLRCFLQSRIYFCQTLLHLPLSAIDGFSSEANYYRKAYESICEKGALHTMDNWDSLREIEQKERRKY